MERIELILSEERVRAAVLRDCGHVTQAQMIERLCSRVESSLRDYLAWLPEREAARISGRSVRWLRARFAEWHAGGHAYKEGRGRRYRALVIPRSKQLPATEELLRSGCSPVVRRRKQPQSCQ